MGSSGMLRQPGGAVECRAEGRSQPFQMRVRTALQI
jgi:hypothetical protein